MTLPQFRYRYIVRGDWLSGQEPMSELIGRLTLFEANIAELFPEADPMRPYEYTGLVSEEHHPELEIKHPLVRDLSQQQWLEYFERILKRSSNCIFCQFSNGSTDSKSGLHYSVHANHRIYATGSPFKNQVVISAFPTVSNKEEVLRKLMQLVIEIWPTQRASVFTLVDDVGEDEDADTGPGYWLYWLADGIDFPPARDEIWPRSQSQNTDKKRWLGGTLYTWPDREPLDLAHFVDR
jgi:hypothetical protein